MNSTSTAIINKTTDPIYQAVFSLAGVLITTIGAKMAGALGIGIHERFPWMAAAAFMLLFAVFNSLISLTTKDMMWYWRRSIYSYMVLAAVSGLVAWAFSSLSIGEAGSFRWIYIVLTIGYMVFLSMMATVRKIVEFAQKEEWNQPRMRHRRGK